MKDYHNSRLLFQECMRIQTKLLGKDDLLIAQSLSWLGRNHQQLNEPTKALEKYLSALQLSKKNKNAVDYRIIVMLLDEIGKTYEDEQVNLSDMALKCKSSSSSRILFSKYHSTQLLHAVLHVSPSRLFRRNSLD